MDFLKEPEPIAQVPSNKMEKDTSPRRINKNKTLKT